MTVSLSKGGNVSLNKEVPGLKRILVGLGWDGRATDGAAFDLDASVFLLKDEGKVRNDSDFVFYNNKEDGIKELAGVKYESMTAILVKAIQEQQAQINELKAQING